MMLACALNTEVHKGHTIILTGAIPFDRVCILVNTGATHNIIDINIARLTGLTEWRITTTILVGSSSKLACQGACFNISLRIDEMFQIDTFFLDIGNDTYIIISTPWLADIGNTL